MNALLPLRSPKAGRAAGAGIIPLEIKRPSRNRNRTPHGNAKPIALSALLADLCYFALRLSGWLALTLLATLGLYAVFFMALGAFTPEGFFAHLENLSVRFGDAEPVRQAHFMDQLAFVTLILFLIVSAARYRSLASVFSATQASRKD
ncbi:MAG: hypothetical protein WBA51_08790 [Erythrobacter sp.]